MMVLVVVVGMVVKLLGIWVIKYYGYWCMFFVNMVMVGLMMVSFVVMMFNVLVWLWIV